MSLPSLPGYARATMSTASDTPKPQVERIDMDRGPAQQRLVNRRLLFNMAVDLIFESQADVNSFMAWYSGTINVIGWFTMKHPRTGALIQARFPSGTLGDVAPIMSGYGMAHITTSIEYYA